MNARVPNHRWPLALALLCGALAQAPAPREDADVKETRFFALHMSRDARALADEVEEHLQAGRWNAAIRGLERLIEDHSSDVLPAERRPSKGAFSEFPAYPGAAEWALARFRELSPEALSAYAARHEEDASRALADARRRGDRRALVEITRRWPVAPATARAWWALGDLELEAGHLAEAKSAWNRGASLDELLGQDTSREAQQRLRLHAALAQRTSPPKPQRGPHEELPRRDAEPWICDLDLEPFHRLSGAAYYQNLLPSLQSERVYVTSTLRVFSVDAYTGEIVWGAGPPAGGDRLDLKHKTPLFTGIADDHVLARPAVGGGVCVAALQIPYSENDNYDWQGIPILTAIPERRLFAFDTRDGHLLWSHAPRLAWETNRWSWDPTFASYSERMLVAAPPTVSGGRVLVPCYRMQGRIDYHVACYDLRTGELLWNTPVVSGQRPRNMFGRPSREFAASPLVVAGDRILAQTDLGTIAALDLLTGRILWQSLYRQIELPKTTSYTPSERALTWRISSPAVADGVVVATPADSHEITALDLEDGRVLWAYDVKQLQRVDRETRDLTLNCLVGADSTTVFLAGQKVSALEKPGGLRTRSPFTSKWTYVVSSKDSMRRAPRVALTESALVIPTRKERVVLDRETGRRLSTHSGEWPSPDYGNPLVRNGVLYILSNERLLGFFDWDALLERQRLKLAQEPSDPETVLGAAELYNRRSRSYIDEGEWARALDTLQRSEELLAPLHGSLRAEDGETRLLRRIDQELHSTLRLQAEVLTRRGNREQALAALDRAIPLASTPEELRDALLQKDRLLLLAQRPRDRLALLAEIEERCGDLPLPEAPARRSPPLWLVGDATLDPSMLADWQRSRIPVRLWALLNRAQIHLALRDPVGCLEDLHRALASYGDLEIADGVDVGTLVRERISMRRLAPDGDRAYAPFERRARELLDRALAQDDANLLREVGRLYPHSRAAQEALHARLDRAFRGGNPEEVARIVASSLSSPGGDRRVEASMLLRLARSLGRNGNIDFERALLTRLVADQPDLVSDLPEDQGLPVRRLLERLEPDTPPAPRRLPGFDSTVISTGLRRDGAYEFVGSLIREEEQLDVYLVNDRLEAFSSANPAEKAWTFYLPEVVLGTQACALDTQRLFVGDQVSLRALDASGRELWERPLTRGALSVEAHAGVCVVNERGGRIDAFDTVGGIPLWNLTLGDSGQWTGPLAGEQRLVFFSQRHAKPERALVVDLFRGRVLFELELGNVDGKLSRTAWISKGRLIVPDFGRYSRPEVVAYSLASGERSWTVRFDEGEILHSIASYDGEDYLITSVAELGRNARAAIYRLDGEFGTLRAVERLTLGEEPVGIAREDHVELSSPYLFTYATEPTPRGVPIRAIHLPFRAVWTYTLALEPRESVGALPRPAVSRDCIAVAYATRNPTGIGRRRTTIVFLDKRAGRRLSTLDLNKDFNHATQLELRGLGEALFVIGQGRRALGLRMETLQKLR